MSETRSPAPETVESFFDETAVMEIFGGENIHPGYWPDPAVDSPDPLADFVEAQDRLTDLVATKCGVRAPARLLDVGCGIGAPARRIARTTGMSVTGVTISPGQVEVATARSSLQGLDELTSFQLADAVALPFGDEEFDGAIAIESVLYIEGKLAAFREIFRALRPGAALVIADFTLKEPEAIKNMLTAGGASVLDLMTPLTEDDYRQLAGQAGFEVTDVLDIGEQTTPSYSRIRLRLAQQHAELTAIVGEEQVTALKQSNVLFEDAVRAGHLGYIVLTAHKPAG